MSDQTSIRTIGVVTSGGDSQGMNATVRAVVRTGLSRGAKVYAIYEGYQGMVEGGDYIRPMAWDSVGGILQQGGTVIGTARSDEFRTLEGRRKAVKNLVDHGIGALVVIGGDGSLTGANLLRQEWANHLTELVATGEISQAQADAYPALMMAGLVGSIDNDMFGTDMTIGADTALHRIVQAVDAIASTAASHQRTFVVEVMGRHSGYLALMSAIATGANWVFIPESPSAAPWEEEMCAAVHGGRDIGRRHTIIIVAEGATDCNGTPIESEYVRTVLADRLGEDVRVTILGHVQRGGAPSAYDRWQSTVLGYHAVDEVLTAQPIDEPKLIGIRHNEILRSPLMENVAKTHDLATAMANQEYEKAMDMRGGSFAESYRIFHTLMRAAPRAPAIGQRRLKIVVLHAGGPAPGMNTAVRVAVRLGMDQGHAMLAARNGFEGLAKGDIHDMDWMSVHGWVMRGGAELGTSRRVPEGRDFYNIARHLEEHQIDGLLVIGGWAGYSSAYQLYARRNEYPAFNIPIACVPATINNNLPGSDYSIGVDTALNGIVIDVDKIKQSAVATRRVFVVEVMGRDCGYLALVSAMASGAERAYIPEEGINLSDLQLDLENLIEGFKRGKRLGLMIRGEKADEVYSTAFLAALFEKEGGELFDVRQVILGHVQQGGNPSPFDRIQATRLASHAIDYLAGQGQANSTEGGMIGLRGGRVVTTNLADLPRLTDPRAQRPRDQWWLRLRPIATIMSQPEPPHV